MKKNTIFDLDSFSTKMRINYLKMVYGSREALIPSVFSIIDIFSYLYKGKYILNKNDPKNLIISKGHSASIIYPFLVESNIINNSDINYGEEGSPFGIYPNTDIPYILCPSGSLGHGLGIAAGLSESQNQHKSPIFVFLGDGECTEGSIWEAALYIGAKNLKNIFCIVDANNRTILGDLNKTYPNIDLKNNFISLGFDVHEINGHNMHEIHKLFENLLNKETDRPNMIYAKTIKGKGIDFMEKSHLWHNRMPTNTQLDEAIKNLQSKI